MLEKQIPYHLPIHPHQCGHPPRLYQRSGDRQQVYFFECSRCLVKTEHCPTPAAAARVWNQGKAQTLTVPDHKPELCVMASSNITPLHKHPY